VSGLLLGAVAYDPKVVTIWEGFRRWFAEHDFGFDFILYSNYDRQVDDLVAGRIDVAWNSPLAWVKAKRLAAGVEAVAMRDTDCDLTSVVVVRADSPIQRPGDLDGKLVATGASDSPQATLLPLSMLRRMGLKPEVRCFEVGFGLHGDHIGGERDAARAMAAGEVDAACMIDGNHLLFAREGVLGPTRIVAQTPPYDHCNMTVRPGFDAGRFRDLLLGMQYSDPMVRPLLDLEGLKQWRPGRVAGYAALERAVDESGFYDGIG
jgi:ABC-type phosphate/phosphonate transport system substrate-binding protein